MTRHHLTDYEAMCHFQWHHSDIVAWAEHRALVLQVPGTPERARARVGDTITVHEDGTWAINEPDQEALW